MARTWRCPKDNLLNDTVTCVKCGTIRPLLEIEKSVEINDKPVDINEKAIMSDGLDRLKGKKKSIPITGTVGRVKLEPNSIILKFKVEDDKLVFETSTGNEAPEVLKGIVRTLLLVLSKSEGLQELMGIARKFMR